MQLNQEALEAYLAHVSDASVQIDRIGELEGSATSTTALKAFGYGRPIRVDYQVLLHGSGGTQLAAARQVVLRQVNRNGFGRERDDDRFAEVWLDYAVFNDLPQHARAQDVVALTRDGRTESVGHVQDFMLVTTYAEGQPYADDLLRIRDNGTATPCDLARAQALASYLVDIHAVKHNDPLLWRRRLRDLVGHGEGIMGLADSYPPDSPLLTSGQLQEIEATANVWRWRLKPLTHRLSQVHGDFHPFNLLFRTEQDFTLLDRSRGAWGEPADDVSCLTINYLFFSLQRYDKLAGPFEELYNAFWTLYMERSQDHELARVIQPWFAWRALVLASPQWYPTIKASVRSSLLTFARTILAERHFDWSQINTYIGG